MKHLELFDSFGEDLRPTIRDERDEKKTKFLVNEGFLYMTLQQYAEYRVCEKPFNELNESEVREIGSNIFSQVGNNPYFHLEKDDSIVNLLLAIEYKIADIVEMYKESDGFYSKQGKLTYRRQVEQAVKLGMDVPKEVLSQKMFGGC